MTRVRGGFTSESIRFKVLDAYEIAYACLNQGLLFEDPRGDAHLSTIKIVKQLSSNNQILLAAKLLTLGVDNGFQFGDQKFITNLLMST